MDGWRKGRSRKEGETEKRNFHVDNHLYKAVLGGGGGSLAIQAKQNAEWTKS